MSNVFGVYEREIIATVTIGTRMKKFLLTLACITMFCCGCHQETAAERRARLRRERNTKIVLVVILAAAVLGGVIVGVQAIRKHVREFRAEELLRDPGRYNVNSKQINQFASDCRFMLFEDSKRGKAFAWRSASKHAREKMVEFIVGAQGPCRRMLRNDPTRDLYFANEELARLYDCCLNCPTHNRNRKTPECRALDGKEVVDLRFEQA